MEAVEFGQCRPEGSLTVRLKLLTVVEISWQIGIISDILVL